jgi:carbamate kinase
MRVVAALGGNALLRRGEPADAETQRVNVRAAVQALAEIARKHDLVVTHGNGPQVGLLALQGEAYRDVQPYPLDVLGAETEGMIGYLLEQELTNELGDVRVATLLTQVLLDPRDPAFGHPTKPIGPVYDRATAERLARDRGWTVAPDGHRWRRVVASPEPLAIVELRTIQLLCDAGTTVICAGGGGIPVAPDAAGRLHGVEAVIDKDLATSLLARELGADALLLLTDVPAVVADWGTDAARALPEATPADLRSLHLEAGSMGPKVEAVCRFAEATGGIAGIGALADAAAILRGEAGTLVTPAAVELTAGAPPPP